MFGSINASSQATPATSETVSRAADSPPTLIENVRVDHRGIQVRLPQQFLNRPNVVPFSSKCVANEWRNT
jgi:hypothetical protein